MGQPEHSRATAGPYTLIIPPNGRATLYEADGAGVDHEVPFGVNSLDALVQFAGEVIRLNAMIGASASLLEAARLALPALEYEAEQCKADDPIRVAAYALRSAIGKTTAPDAPGISVGCGVPAARRFHQERPMTERRHLFSAIEVTLPDGSKHIELDWHPSMYLALDVLGPNGEITDKIVDVAEELIHCFDEEDATT